MSADVKVIKAIYPTVAEFCDSLNWGIGVDWLDFTGIHQLDDNRVVKLELQSRGGLINNYTGFFVTLVHKMTGVIDTKYFGFSDYLPQGRNHRTDTCNDESVWFSVTYTQKLWQWHNYIPRST